MRRDYFSVDVASDPDDDAIPTVDIRYDGPTGAVAKRLTTDSGTLEADEVDVTFRRQRDSDTGVLSVTNRLTGEYVLESSVPFDEIEMLVAAAEARSEDDPQYRVRVTDSQGTATVYEKHTLLVYDHDGGLLRQRSLIPGSVEL